MRRNFILIISFCLPFFIFGCAATPKYMYIPGAPAYSKTHGIYHKVEKGQTLWRIAKFYNVAMEDIIKANRIPNAAQISTGQLLFIPRASENAAKPAENLLSPNSFKEPDFIWPARGKTMFFYGSKKNGVLNKGIDIYVKEGTKVAAARAGKVVFCDIKLKGYGKTIIIDHLDGFSTLYAHNSAILTSIGDYVKQGQVIAKTGSSGRTSQSCLHFQIRKGDKPQNPFYYLPR